jgi:hypothetical protein
MVRQAVRATAPCAVMKKGFDRHARCVKTPYDVYYYIMKRLLTSMRLMLTGREGGHQIATAVEVSAQHTTSGKPQHSPWIQDRLSKASEGHMSRPPLCTMARSVRSIYDKQRCSSKARMSTSRHAGFKRPGYVSFNITQPCYWLCQEQLARMQCLQVEQFVYVHCTAT